MQLIAPSSLPGRCLAARREHPQHLGAASRRAHLETVLGTGWEDEGISLVKGEVLVGYGYLELPRQHEDELNIRRQGVRVRCRCRRRLDVAEDGLHTFLARRREQVLPHPGTAEIDGRTGSALDYLPLGRRMSETTETFARSRCPGCGKERPMSVTS